MLAPGSRFYLDFTRWNPAADAWVPDGDVCPHCGEAPSDSPPSWWLHAPLDNGWTAALRIFVQGGHPVVGELRVFPDEGDGWKRYGPARWSAEQHGHDAPVPPGGLTARKLRDVKLDTLMREAAASIGEWDRWWRDVLPASGQTPILLPGLASAAERGPARRNRAASRTDLELAKVAAEYVAACTKRAPIRTLAEAHPEWGEGAVAQSMARGLVFAARERRLLTAVGRGRAGGALTEKAKRLLREEEDRP